MYSVGVDIGTTYTAAAVWRDGRAEICSLGTRSAEVPSVVLARADGTVLAGEPAARRAVSEPDRVAREFKRRIGDATPLLLGGSPYSAETLTARLLSWVMTVVSEREGGPPARVCVTHPANWGPYKLDLLRQAVALAGLDMPVVFTTEPEAAAICYARTERLTAGDTVAVYDLGGGTFDAAVLRRTGTGFAILGQPEGIERLGGIDIDAAVYAHVARTVGESFADLDEDDPATVAAVARLRAECTAAKEALSSDTDTTIPVLLPSVTTDVRLTRAELESMVRPPLYDSIEATKRALRSAGVTAEELSAVLLVGGSSRMPLVAQLVGAELGRPVAVDAHPKHAVALGAAWLSSGRALPADPAGPAPATVVVSAADAPPATVTPPAAPQTVVTPQVKTSRPEDRTAVLPASNGPAPSGPAPHGVPDVPGPSSRGFAPAPPAQPFAVPGHGLPAPLPAPTRRRGRPAWTVPVVAAAVVLLALFGGYGVWRAQSSNGVGIDPSDPGRSLTVNNANDSTTAVAPADTPPVTVMPSTQVASGPPLIRLVVEVDGAGKVSGGGALVCRSSCQAYLPSGTTRRLVAEPAAGSDFVRWRNCPRTSGRQCTVTVKGETVVTAVFEKSAPTSVTSEPSGAVTSGGTSLPPSSRVGTPGSPPPTEPGTDPDGTTDPSGNVPSGTASGPAPVTETTTSGWHTP